ncbi:hypothetical protein Rhopal_004350-T1 [Rhodotorula paludigena]|uniref:Endothelin-converting enzyme 1 n=1 Tax=Rhodotorula paludigena TaxID=86838 RepID=A0AAV5GLH2_9BASI|nr:hypothetical protein Rhopal_004350-T1 [Rhodotorula paludigena]
MSRAAADEQEPLLGDEAQPADAAPSRSLSSRLRTALHEPRRLTGLEKALAALAIVLLLTTATGFGLFAGEAVRYGNLKRHRHDHPAPPHRPRPTATQTASRIPGPTPTHLPPPGPPKNPDHPADDEVCLSPSCVRTAATFLAGLDPSVDPCDDFDAFANGGWRAEHPIPAGSGQFGSAQDIDLRNKRVVRAVLERSPAKEHGLVNADRENLAHLRSFWEACNDEETLEKRGSKPLLDVVGEVIALWRGDASATGVEEVEASEDDVDFLLQLNGLEPTGHKHRKGRGGNRKSRKWDPATKRARLTDALAYLHSRGITALFETYTDGDVGREPSKVVLWLSQSGLGLPSKDYYKDHETVQVYEDTVKAVLDSVYQARRETDMGGLASSVVRLEKAIAKISLDVEKLDEPIPTYNPHNASALQALFPSISFADYFSSYTPRPHFPDPVIVTSPEFFGNLTTLLDKTAPDVLEAYMVFQASLELAPLLGSKQPIQQRVSQLTNRLRGVAPDAHKPRDEVCLDALLSSFGYSVGRYFVEEAFAGDSKAYAEDVIRAIIQAFQDRLPGRTWLDDETRAKASEKVAAIRYKIGYPTSPNTTDPASLARYYAINLPVESDDYFGNVVRSRVADERRKWIKVGRPKDRGEFDMIPSEVNAYFSPSDNEIVFPAGILQFPYFSIDWPEYAVFGSFGGVAGHELTHSLDQSGRQYDKDGRLVDWWGPDTSKHFLERQACFERQYANYSVVGSDGKRHYINSKFTGGEDGADAGGVAQAWTAWQSRRGSDEHANYLLPGLQQYSREQLFFVAYAQGWAMNISPGESQRRIAVDPHSPAKFRVIGPLSNNADFAEAFNCPVGSPMNRGQARCELW